MDANELEAYISAFYKDQQARGVDFLQNKTDKELQEMSKIKEAKND